VSSTRSPTHPHRPQPSRQSGRVTRVPSRSPDAPLRANVRLLGEILGTVVAEPGDGGGRVDDVGHHHRREHAIVARRLRHRLAGVLTHERLDDVEDLIRVDGDEVRAMCNQIQSADLSRIGEFKAALSDEDMRRVDQALRIQLALA